VAVSGVEVLEPEEVRVVDCEAGGKYRSSDLTEVVQKAVVRGD
jgi:hypothetical protein